MPIKSLIRSNFNGNH